MHLTRFRLVEKQSATVRTHTCALSWTSPFKNTTMKLSANERKLSDVILQLLSDVWCHTSAVIYYLLSDVWFLIADVIIFVYEVPCIFWHYINVDELSWITLKKLLQSAMKLLQIATVQGILPNSFTLRRVSVLQNECFRVVHIKKPDYKENVQATIYFKKINS